MAGYSTRLLIESATYLGGCAFGLWKGGRPERLAALALIAEFVVINLINGLHLAKYSGIIVMTSDFAVVLFFWFLAMRFDERWLLLGCAFQTLSTFANLTRLIDRSIGIWSFMTVGIAFGYGVVACLVYGTILAMLNRRRALS